MAAKCPARGRMEVVKTTTEDLVSPNPREQMPMQEMDALLMAESASKRTPTRRGPKTKFIYVIDIGALLPWRRNALSKQREVRSLAITCSASLFCSQRTRELRHHVGFFFGFSISESSFLWHLATAFCIFLRLLVAFAASSKIA